MCRLLVSAVAALALVTTMATGCATYAVRHARPSPRLVSCRGAECLRVLTWNVHAIPFISPKPTKRLRNVATKIREQQPDLVLLQEVWAHAYARKLARELEGQYRLTIATGCGRPFPCGGLAVLVRNASGWVASQPTFVAYAASAPWYRLFEWDGIAKKGMLMVDLARGSESLAVVDTHLQSQYVRYGRDYTELRRSQLDQLASTLRTFGDRPIVIGGDFNTAPEERSALYETNVATLGDDRTTEVRATCGECGTRPSLVRPARWIDYVITRNVTATPTVERIVNDTVDRPYSDHEGVLVRLEYRPAPVRAEDREVSTR